MPDASPFTLGLAPTFDLCQIIQAGFPWNKFKPHTVNDMFDRWVFRQLLNAKRCIMKGLKD